MPFLIYFLIKSSATILYETWNRYITRNNILKKICIFELIFFLLPLSIYIYIYIISIIYKSKGKYHIFWLIWSSESPRFCKTILFWISFSVFRNILNSSKTIKGFAFVSNNYSALWQTAMLLKDRKYTYLVHSLNAPITERMLHQFLLCWL